MSVWVASKGEHALLLSINASNVEDSMLGKIIA